MALAFGLVGLDRYILFPLFPVIAEDLGLDYADLGLISGSLALTWGLASIFSGNLADRIGARRVIVVSIITFSTLVAFTGLATGLVSLLALRALMGFAEGGFAPAGIVQTIQVSKPSRVGLNFGLQQMAAPLFGLGLGPIIAVSLLSVLPSWEWVFGVIALPGFIVALVIARTVQPSTGESSAGSPRAQVSLTAPLKYSNVLLGSCALISIFVAMNTLSTFGPNYLTDHIGLSLSQMGAVMSSLGAGGLLGMITLPALSDRIGRKFVMVGSLVALVAALSLLMTAEAGTPLPMLAAIFFTVSASSSGSIATLVGPVISGSVPTPIAATATGIVVGLGEIFGGAVAPAITGFLLEAQGIQFISVIMISGGIVGLLIVLFGIKEP
ncbi:MAG: MFS transporter [Pseudomonadota bacterium]